jgi:ribosome-binding ATPase YchF (GTP1/OBG family)
MSTGKVDPIADAETVETELMLADLESLEKRVPNYIKKGQQGDKEAKIAASCSARRSNCCARASPRG